MHLILILHLAGLFVGLHGLECVTETIAGVFAPDLADVAASQLLATHLTAPNLVMRLAVIT